jgi:iron(III) transport system permease protein
MPMPAGRGLRIAQALDGLRQEWLRTILTVAAVGIVGWLVLYPLGILLRIGVRAPDGSWTLANYRAVLTEPTLYDSLVNSIILSVGATAVALVIALPLAWGVARTRMPWRGFITTMVTVAFVIPNFIGAIAWILLLGPNAGLLNVAVRALTGLHSWFNIYSMQGLIVVLAFSFYPLIFFAAVAALENMDPALEEAAQMSGASAWRGSIEIVTPLILPAVVSSSVLVFLESMGAFGAPAAIANSAGFQTLTTKLYDLFSYPPHFELAAACATPILVFTLLGLWVQRLALGRRRYAVISGKATRTHPVEIGAARWVLFGYSLLVVVATVLLPVFVLVRTSLLTRWGRPFIWRNLTLYNYEAFGDTSTFVPHALVNSLLTSAATACFAVFLGIFIVWLVERTTVPGRGLITVVSTVTFAFPGIGLAVGFVLGYNGGWLPLYGTLWLFLLAFTAQRFPFAFMFLRSAVKQLSPELEEAGRMAGASWARSLRDISVPLLRGGMLAAWIMVFAVTMRELSMAILLYVKGTETLPVAIFSFVDDGTFETASALSVVLVLVSVAAVLLLRRLAGANATRL